MNDQTQGSPSAGPAPVITRRTALFGVGAGVALGSGIGTSAAAAPRTSPTRTRAAKTRTLRVLQLNVWLSATAVAGAADGVADTIASAKADIVMLSESSPDHVAWLVEALRKRSRSYDENRTSADNAVLSTFPIRSVAEFPFWSKAVVDVDGTAVAAYSGHLNYRYYMNYLPRGYGGGVPEPEPTWQWGWDEIPEGPVTDLKLIMELNEASGRTASCRPVLDDAADERRAGGITILAGDFNEPSHQDWTPVTRSRFDHRGMVVPWSTTKSLADAGFVDSYRQRHPNPLLAPGFTWPSDNPGAPVDRLTWTPKADERDRIDYVLYHPDPRLALTDSVVVGPKTSIVRSRRVPERGRDRFLIPSWTWPSDHKGVLSTFSLRS